MKIKKRLSVYVGVIILIIIDQVIKLWMINNIKDNSVTVIKGILNFSYCENRGVAFSFGNGYVPVFIIVNLLIICGLLFYFERNRDEFNRLDKIFFVMVTAGGISNLIDRIIKGYVVDFIDINQLFEFAIFNVADIFIVAGVCGFFADIIFKNFKSYKKQRKDYNNGYE